MPPKQTCDTLRVALSGNYVVLDVQLTAPIPDDVETLVLAGPANLDATAAEHVDQFVMRGGSLVGLAGRYRLAPAEGLAAEKVTTGRESLFTKWGITVGDQLVMDPKDDSFPGPQNRSLGNGMVVREVHEVPYPYFVKLDGDQLSDGSIITSGLAGAVMPFASPLTADAKAGADNHTVDTLLRSSSDATLTTSTAIEP